MPSHRPLTVPAIVALLLSAAGCRQAPPSETTPAPSPAPVTISAVMSPAVPGSLEPQVTTSARGLLASWVERVDGKTTLKFAERTGTNWGPTRVVASGSNWFVSHADVPTVQRLSNGTIVANWLVETDAALEAYDLMLSYSADDGVTWAKPFSPHHDGTKTQHGFASFYETPDAFGLVWLDGRAQELDTTSPDGGARHRPDRKSTRLNSSHTDISRMPSSA